MARSRFLTKEKKTENRGCFDTEPGISFSVNQRAITLLTQTCTSCVKMPLFTFSKQAFNESLDFCNHHSLMDDINLIDSCLIEAHLPVQNASNIEFKHQK